MRSPLALVRQAEDVAHSHLQRLGDQGVDAVRRLSVDLRDHVSRPQARLVGGAAGGHGLDEQPGGDRLDLNAETRPGDLASAAIPSARSIGIAKPSEAETVRSDDIPDNGSVAAILRYAP